MGGKAFLWTISWKIADTPNNDTPYFPIKEINSPKNAEIAPANQNRIVTLVSSQPFASNDDESEQQERFFYRLVALSKPTVIKTILPRQQAQDQW